MIKKQAKSNVGVIKSKVLIDGCTYTTYGIKYKYFSLADISTDRDFVEALLKTIKDEHIENCHIMNFIEDEIERNA